MKKRKKKQKPNGYNGTVLVYPLEKGPGLNIPIIKGIIQAWHYLSLNLIIIGNTRDYIKENSYKGLHPLKFIVFTI